MEEARRDRRLWLEKGAGKSPQLGAWGEANLEETWTFHRLPRDPPQPLKSTHLRERFNPEIQRRTPGGRIFPDEASGRRRVRAVAAGQHAEWMEGSRYLNMDRLPRREAGPLLAAA